MKYILFISLSLLGLSSANASDPICNLWGTPNCTYGTLLSGTVDVNSDTNYDIQLDGNYVGNTRFVWDTTVDSVGSHTLQECSTQPVNKQVCNTVWVPKMVWVPDWVWIPNWVWVPNIVWVSNWVWVSDWQCDSYDDNGNCIDWVDNGYYEDDGSYVDEGSWVDEGQYVDEGGWVDEGSYQNVCTIVTVPTYVCSGQLNVTVERTAAPGHQINSGQMGDYTHGDRCSSGLEPFNFDTTTNHGTLGLLFSCWATGSQCQIAHRGFTDAPTNYIIRRSDVNSDGSCDTSFGCGDCPNHSPLTIGYGQMGDYSLGDRCDTGLQAFNLDISTGHGTLGSKFSCYYPTTLFQCTKTGRGYADAPTDYIERISDRPGFKYPNGMVRLSLECDFSFGCGDCTPPVMVPYTPIRRPVK